MRCHNSDKMNNLLKQRSKQQTCQINIFFGLTLTEFHIKINYQCQKYLNFWILETICFLKCCPIFDGVCESQWKSYKKYLPFWFFKNLLPVEVN